MSSQRKTDSARANGATARTLVLSLEDREEFEALRDTCLREFQPQTQVERDPVDQIISARWHSDRICSTETAELDLELARQEDHIQKTFDVIDHETLSDESNCLALLSRCEALYRRNYEPAEARGTGMRVGGPNSTGCKTNPIPFPNTPAATPRNFLPSPHRPSRRPRTAGRSSIRPGAETPAPHGRVCRTAFGPIPHPHPSRPRPNSTRCKTNHP